MLRRRPPTDATDLVAYRDAGEFALPVWNLPIGDRAFLDATYDYSGGAAEPLSTVHAVEVERTVRPRRSRPEVRDALRRVTGTRGRVGDDQPDARLDDLEDP